MYRDHPVLDTWLKCAIALLVLLTGCTRNRYRMRADADAYTILNEKTWCCPWIPPQDFDLIPDPRSRLYDPTPINDPQLPNPAPQLYAYDLPALPPRDPDRYLVSWLDRQQRRSQLARLNQHRWASLPGHDQLRRLPAVTADWDRWGLRSAMLPNSHGRPAWQSSAGSAVESAYPVRQQAFLQPLSPPNLETAEDQPPALDPTRGNLPEPQRADEPGEHEQDLQHGPDYQMVPIPASAWQTIPPNCLRRMFEFESVRQQYQRSFGREPSPAERDPSPKLTLEDIVDLAQLNARDYQTQKESLYRTALNLSLERFDYQLKPSTSNNDTAANFNHSRNGGTTVNTLSIPTNLQVDKMLITGGDLLARFANDVILTYNGPQGFAADIGSDLLFDFSQSVFQRDVRFENLTQAERNVVYAARDLARFRKLLFTDLASRYYSLLLTYRNIEINSENYFTLVNQFQQTEEEFERGFQQRVQLDQIEQQVLGGRSSLIRNCDALENALDDLKFRIGLPTESPINLDLTELDQLTLRDELAVTGELITRVRRRLVRERQSQLPERSTLVTVGIGLIDRILDAYDLQRRLRLEEKDPRALEDVRTRLEIDAARLVAEEERTHLNEELTAEAPTPIIVFQRTLNLTEALLSLVLRQMELADRIDVEAQRRAEFRERYQQLVDRDTQLRSERLAEAVIDDLVTRSRNLQIDTEALVQELNQATGYGELQGEQQLQRMFEQADLLLVESQQLLATIEGGLVPIDIGVDDAMLTSLVQRFDLMNERGFLADDWRQIKLAADDLKSILNLNASQSIRTRANVNRPFGFTFDESQSQLSATFDAPFNRRAQRNRFRNSLIDYQAALRRLMQLEDSVKLDVRDDLRSLALNQEQYLIQVAAAALAFDRVVTTEFQYRRNIGGVIARDFLEAQSDYTEALNSVAGEHINYIQNRIQLFLDLESLTIDNNGFWPEIYDEQHRLTPNYQLPPYATPAYGELPRVHYSRRVKRMLDVPTGTSMIHNGPPDHPIEMNYGAEDVPPPVLMQPPQE